MRHYCSNATTFARIAVRVIPPASAVTVSSTHLIALASISDEAAQASARGPVYSLNLGDLSHDLYWYQYDFDVSSAKRFLEQNGFPTLLYSIPGNHDNDGATPAGVGVDRRAEHLYRRTFGPTYYAMNIGDVHWIMMDNIIYKNCLLYTSRCV